MLRVRMTLPHFSVSSAMSLPKSAGEPGSTLPPRSASRAFIWGSASAALTSLLIEAGGGKSHNDPHGPRRIGLRPRDARYRRQRGSARGQMQEFAAGKFQFDPP